MGESARKQADDLNARALMMGERARKQAVPSAITSEIFEIFPNFARVPSKVTWAELSIIQYKEKKFQKLCILFVDQNYFC